LRIRPRKSSSSVTGATTTSRIHDASALCPPSRACSTMATTQAGIGSTVRTRLSASDRTIESPAIETTRGGTSHGVNLRKGRNSRIGPRRSRIPAAMTMPMATVLIAARERGWVPREISPPRFKATEAPRSVACSAAEHPHWIARASRVTPQPKLSAGNRQRPGSWSGRSTLGYSLGLA